MDTRQRRRKPPSVGHVAFFEYDHGAAGNVALVKHAAGADVAANCLRMQSKNLCGFLRARAAALALHHAVTRSTVPHLIATMLH